MRIMHVLAPARVGGLETVVTTLASAQAERGHHVTVVAIVEEPNHPFVTALATRGVDTRVIVANGRRYGRERGAFLEALLATRPDVVHSHGYRPDIVDLPVARRNGIATVTTFHGFTGTDWKLRIYERLQMHAARSAGAVIAVSRGVQQRLHASGVRPERVHVIRNAYAPTTGRLSRPDALRLLGASDSAFRIGWIGRLSREKGPDVMLDAFACLRDTPATLSFVGDGPDRPVLTHRAAEMGMSGRVTFHGVLPDASRVLPAFDVLALSSRTEGTPMVILEAMASETPVVATNVGGLPDMLGPMDAMLVQPEDPAELARALISVLHDPAAATLRAHSARARLDAEFGPEEWLARHENLYASLLR